MREKGYSIVEMLVVIFLLALAFMVIYQALISTSRVTSLEVSLSKLQHGIRSAQEEIREKLQLAGRGGMVVATQPSGSFKLAAINVINNVPNGTTVGSIPVLEGTDVLVVRGVINTPIFLISEGTDTSGQPFFSITPDGSGSQIDTISIILTKKPDASKPLSQPIDEVFCDPTTGLANSNANLAAIVPNRHDSTIYGVFVVQQISCSGSGTNQKVTLTLKRPSKAGNSQLEELATTYDVSDLQKANKVGILEQYVYYVMAPAAIPATGVSGSELMPRIMRAKVDLSADPDDASELASLTPYLNNPDNLVQEVADNIFDLQVSLGFDYQDLGTDDPPLGNTAHPDGVVTQADQYSNRSNDEFLFNHPNDNMNNVLSNLFANNGAFRYARVSVLGVSPYVDVYARDNLGLITPVTRIEDRDYGANHPLNNSMTSLTLSGFTLRGAEYVRKRRKIVTFTVDARVQ